MDLNRWMRWCCRSISARCNHCYMYPFFLNILNYSIRQCSLLISIFFFCPDMSSWMPWRIDIIVMTGWVWCRRCIQKEWTKRVPNICCLIRLFNQPMWDCVNWGCDWYHCNIACKLTSHHGNSFDFFWIYRSLNELAGALTNVLLYRGHHSFPVPCGF